MKRDSKGQQVKTFKHYIPNADLTKTETQVKVYFKADTGMFTIYDGAHMYLAAADRADLRMSGRARTLHADRVSDNTMDGVISAFKTICHAYEEEMKNSHKKKVIRFTFKANAPWHRDGQAALSDISFCGSPAIHLTYEVLYQIGDQVYEQTEEGATLQYRGKAAEARYRGGEAITIDWTAEREAFFENMRASLISLIHQVDDFQKNLLINVDKAIAANGPLLLTHKGAN